MMSVQSGINLARPIPDTNAAVQRAVSVVREMRLRCLAMALLLALVIGTSDSRAQVPSADSLALVALYNSTNGASWTNNTNWLTGPVRLWYGVTVFNDDGGDRVTEVDLNSNNLSGPIPPDLGNLSALQYLRLDNNILSGTIPIELTNLSNLISINLASNQLTGTILGSFSNISTLVNLLLNDNKLTGGVPPALGNLPSLVFLWLQDNQLTGTIPVELKNLPGIESLILGGNPINGMIPPELGGLSTLKYLGLFRTQLNGNIPVELGNLTNLIALQLQQSQFGGTIPSELGNLINLTFLRLDGNQLTGDVPPGFTNLGALQVFWVEDNQLTGFPDFGGHESLQSIYAKNNRFTFEDIEPNIGVPSTLFEYAPQANVGTVRNEIVTEGQNLLLHIPVGGSFNQYQWYKGGVPIAGANSDAYVIGFATATDAGSYTLEITNTLASDLTLMSEPINVVVNAIPPSINVVRPNGGEVWTFGTSEQLQWTSQNVSGNVHIELWQSGNFNRVIANNTENDGAFDWLIPGDLSEGSSYRVVISSVSNQDVLDQSDFAFSLASGAQPNITVLRPNFGGTFVRGTTEQIQWTSQDISGNVRIELWQGGSLNRVITGSTVNTGSFDWLIPGDVPVGSDYRIRVSSVNEPGVFDESDEVFGIEEPVQPQITVTQPNGGETWSLGTTVLLQWTSQDVSGNVRVELWQGGSLNRVITGSTVNTGSFDWLIPGDVPVGSDYRIRVSSVNEPSVFDESDEVFGIEEPVQPQITVTQPNGGETWSLGTTVLLQWTSQDVSGNVRVELWQGGSLNRVIVANVANTGVFDWSIPGDVIEGSNYRIRVSSVNEPGVFDESDATFMIQMIVPQTSPDEDALVALFNSTGGNNWTNNANWLTGLPIGAWYGVSVETIGDVDRVVSIDLPDNNLTGVLPTEWVDLIVQQGAFSELRHLFITVNQLGGTLLPVLGNLTQLESLHLANNDLNGGIPATLGNLSNLTSLYLGGNQLSGSIPPEIGNLSLMEDLQLFGNALTGSIPPEIGNLTSLGSLLLHSNLLDGSLPQTIGNLSQLRLLHLRRNQLSGELPSTMANMVLLEVLDLDDNQFSGSFPVWIPNLSGLREIHLNGNLFTGSIPAAIGNLSNLEFLELGGNQLSSEIPVGLGNLTQLTWLGLSGQDIHGSIPPELGNLRNLTLLACSEANLTGSIPTEIGNLTNLTFLHFGNNNLTGTIPASLGNLTNLDGLLLFNNQLSGSIPSELGNLANLNELAIQANAFTGAVPSSFSNLSNLQSLSVFDNNLDVLPDLSGLPALSELLVQNNRFTFEDLEPNASISNFGYAPQASFGEAATLDLLEGDGFTLNIPVGGSNNQYQWFRSGSAIPGATSDSYDVGSSTQGDNGDYTLEATNSVLPGLTLQSETITVNVEALIITVTEPGDVSPSSGNAVPLEAELPALFDPQTREICFRRTGEPDYQCLPLVTEGTLNTASIPGEFITERGVDYFYRFVSGQTIVTIPRENAESDPFRLLIPFSAIVTPIVFAERTYSMISVPVDLDDPRISTVLPDVGTSSAERLLRWNTRGERYDEAPNLTSNFSPGNAFWYISTEADDFMVNGGTTVDPSAPYSITLLPGFSQIGTPFAFTVAWSDVLNSSSVDAPVSYDASLGVDDPYRYNQAVLEPWEGYWVNNPLSETVVIQVQPIEASNSPGKHASQSELSKMASYVVQLEASLLSHKLRDTQNYLGLAEGATDGHDSIDFAEAPGIGKHVRLSIIEDGTRMAGSFKSEAGQGHEWYLELTAELPSELSKTGEYVQILVHESGALPPGFKLYIVDDDEDERIPLIESSFGVRLTSDHPVRHLRIIVGTSTYASEQTDGIALVPQKFALEQNYPNPFNPSTHIRYQLRESSSVRLVIFNSLGQRVTTLVDASQQAGWYEVVWDGRDNAGRQTASGLYFYRFEASGITDTKSMVLLR